MELTEENLLRESLAAWRRKCRERYGFVPISSVRLALFHKNIVYMEKVGIYCFLSRVYKESRDGY